MAAENEITAPPGFEDGTAFQPEPVAVAPETVETPPAEQDAPAEPVAPVEATPAAPAPAAPPNPQVGLLRDLQDERRVRQDAEREVARLKGQLEGIQMEQRRGPAAPTPLSPAVVAKATQWAHRWGLYTPEGQPDVQAAANALDELRSDFAGQVTEQVNARVQPVVQVLQTAHAQAKVAEIVRIGSQYGADPTLLQTYASNLASIQPEALDDQNVVVGLIGLSRGMGSLANPTPATPARPMTPTTIPAPNLTEAPGRRVTAAPVLQGIERQIAQKRGVTNEKWAALSKDFENMDPTRGLVVEKD